MTGKRLRGVWRNVSENDAMGRADVLMQAECRLLACLHECSRHVRSTSQVCAMVSLCNLCCVLCAVGGLWVSLCGGVLVPSQHACWCACVCACSCVCCWVSLLRLQQVDTSPLVQLRAATPLAASAPVAKRTITAGRGVTSESQAAAGVFFFSRAAASQQRKEVRGRLGLRGMQ